MSQNLPARRAPAIATLDTARSGLGIHKRTADQVIPEGLRGAAAAIIHDFAYQSTLSTVNTQYGLTYQPASQNGINPNDEQTSDQAGVGFALSPLSETPIAVQPTQTSKGGGSGQSILLKPGQVHYPGADFRGFKWGLPSGWLGGGLAHLIVIKEDRGSTFWTDDPEVIFHRVTLPIFQPADNPAVLPANWPLRFPWENAASATGPNGLTVLSGTPRMAVTPTKTLFRLRLATLAKPATTRLLFTETDQFDGNGVNNYFINTASWLDLFWQTYAPTGFTVNGVAYPEYPVQVLTGEACRLGGDSTALAIVDVSPAAIAEGSFMDIVRYGQLGSSGS